MRSRSTSSRRDFDRQYAEVMRDLWHHPKNDQRPAVLRWIKPFRGAFHHILDAGAGDAYYLGHLAPKSYIFVEPNRTLRQVSKARAATLGISARAFSSVQSLLRRPGSLNCDLALVIHALLYMRSDEIALLLPKIASKPLVIVHPWLGRSTTIQFEESIGLGLSREKIALKRQILGRPTASRLIDSHLRLPLHTTIASLAFLAAHSTLDGTHDEERLERAHAFVRRRINRWRRRFWYDLPQAQVMEYYNLPSSVG